MDILYLLGKNCSKCNDNELKYSLRSIEKFGKNVGNIYVAGYCPEWLSDKVHKVPVKLIYENPANVTEKHNNMLATILYVVDNTNISDEFLLSMDDHFYISEVDFDNYPIYAKIVKNDVKINPNLLSTYGKFMNSTKKFLESLGLPIYYFTLHRNMHLSKSIINKCRTILDKVIKDKISCEHIALILNFLYKEKPFDFVPIKDIKLKDMTLWDKVDPKITEVFSTVNFSEDSGLNTAIKNLFPNKSKYEK